MICLSMFAMGMHGTLRRHAMRGNTHNIDYDIHHHLGTTTLHTYHTCTHNTTVHTETVEHIAHEWGILVLSLMLVEFTSSYAQQLCIFWLVACASTYYRKFSVYPHNTTHHNTTRYPHPLLTPPLRCGTRRMRRRNRSIVPLLAHTHFTTVYYRLPYLHHHGPHEQHNNDTTRPPTSSCFMARVVGTLDLCRCALSRFFCACCKKAAPPASRCVPTV